MLSRHRLPDTNKRREVSDNPVHKNISYFFEINNIYSYICTPFFKGEICPDGAFFKLPM
jgi:hypothetical protein